MVNTHSLYKKYLNQWMRIRDVIEGQDAVKDKGITYLPALSGQSNNEYLAYKQRALFVNVASRIAVSNAGVITRRDPVTEYPESMGYLFADGLGICSFNEIFGYIVDELLQMGRVGLLVDIRDNKPVVLRYSTESIINWYVDKDGKLVDIILRSDVVEELNGTSNAVYFRLQLIDNVYTISEMDDVGNFVSTTTPTIRGKSLDFIPIIIATPKGLNVNPVKSPIIDIVNINLSHYLSSADLENGRHFTSLPTPVVSGSNTDEPLYIGSSKAWILPNDNSKAYFLEFNGQGLQSLEKALAEKQAQMSQFNANLMDSNTRGSEAEGIVKLRHASDAATLSDISSTAESMLNLTYKIAGTFLGNYEESVSIAINKNFLDLKLTHSELAVLSKAYLDGTIDKQTYMYNLQRGEMLDPGHKISGGD